MIGLPEFSTAKKPVRVRIWPAVGRMVQDGHRPVDRWGGGSWLPTSGKVVEWTPFHYEQLLHGDIYLHHPPCESHDHAGEEKDGECVNCGRTPDEAKAYDAHAVPARAKVAKPEPADDKPYSHADATEAHLKALEKSAAE